MREGDQATQVLELTVHRTRPVVRTTVQNASPTTGGITSGLYAHVHACAGAAVKMLPAAATVATNRLTDLRIVSSSLSPDPTRESSGERGPSLLAPRV
jgi:hypothetical protein